MTGQILAVASGKGGVGKTTTVINLGVALREQEYSVALVDADLGMANLATLLGVDVGPTIHNVLAGEASLDAAIIKNAEGFSILPGATSLDAFANASPDRLEDTLESLADDHDYVLVDTGAGLSYEDVSPLAITDAVILVTTPDPTAIIDTSKTVELAEMLETPIRGVVVTHVDAETEPDTIADRLGVPLLGEIPRSDSVTESVTSATPLRAFAPESEATNAYLQLAETITDDTRPEPDVDDQNDGESEPDTEADEDAETTVEMDESEPADTDDANSGGIFSWFTGIFK